MDTLSHYLWAVAIYWYFRKPRRWLLGLSGALPDLLSFGFIFLMEFGHLGNGPPPLDSIPGFVFTMYNITHSLVVVGVAFLLLWFTKRTWTVFLWGWIAHVLADIPTHTRRYFPTPFLWPVSGYTFSGFSWGQWWFMLLNYGALAAAFSLLWNRDRKARSRMKSL